MDARGGIGAGSAHAALLLSPTSTGSAAIVRALEDHGVSHVRASRWTELLQAISDREPALIIFELGMTGSPGPRLVPMVRAVAPSAVLLAVSEIGSLDIPGGQVERIHTLAPGDLRPLTVVLRQLLGAGT